MVEVDIGSALEGIALRDDVGDVFVVIIDDGRPIDLMRLPRPANGILSPRELLSGRRAPDLAHRTNVARTSSPQPISVVIPTRERPDDLRRCLESLSGVQAQGHEVVVVDNAPRTDRTAVVATECGVRRVMEPVPGINNARNAGVAAATHDIVAFIDDDAVASRTWLQALGARFEDPTIGCATGLVLPLELETPAQENFERYCRPRRDLQSHVYSRDTLSPSAAGVVGMGANMAFRRRLIMDLGWFDPRLGTGTSTRGGDENDMFARILDAGRRIVYAPEAYIWHRHRRTDRELRSCVFGYGIGVFSMLTKRLVEHRDAGAIVTGGRWLLGPLVKAARAKMTGVPSPPWRVVLAETAGAPLGPICYVYETWRGRRRAAAR